MQAEDGDPSGLVKSLEAMHHASNLHGVFNTPLGAMGAGPIRPGESYEYSFTAMPGMKLFTAMMYGQSNDRFYSPDGSGIALFDAKGNPISADVTDKLILWDAGTEVDEEIGIGPNQGPRQKGMNTGARPAWRRASCEDARWTGKNAEFFRVTITAEPGCKCIVRQSVAVLAVDGTKQVQTESTDIRPERGEAYETESKDGRS